MENRLQFAFDSMSSSLLLFIGSFSLALSVPALGTSASIYKRSPRAEATLPEHKASPARTTAAAAEGTKVRITVTFASVPSSATARIAPTLYNKTRVLHVEADDSPLSAYTDLFVLLKGGVRNGVSYPGLRFTDGCGQARPYTAAVAINGRNTHNNLVWLDPGPQHDPGRLVWTQAQEMLNNGWDIENHSDLHTTTNPAQQLASLDALIADRLQGYKPSVHIVPTNFAGYPTAAFAAGYAAVSSASQGDNFPMLNTWDDKRVALSALPAPTTSFVYRRYQADQNTYGGETDEAFLNRLKAVSDNLMAPGTTASEVYVQRVFTHGMSFSALSNWLNYTQSIAQDRLWVTTLREFSEYRRVSAQVVKTETLSNNVLTIDLDYATLSPNTRFQNLTLLVNAPVAVTSITVTGADGSSFNSSTKMVNVFRSQVASTTAPASAPTPTHLHLPGSH